MESFWIQIAQAIAQNPKSTIQQLGLLSRCHFTTNVEDAFVEMLEVNYTLEWLCLQIPRPDEGKPVDAVDTQKSNFFKGSMTMEERTW